MKDNVTIGILGHYGNNNLGDEAIILAVIQNLKQRIPNVEIRCFSINPKDSEARYGVPSYPIRIEKKNAEVNIQADHNAKISKSQDETINEESASKVIQIKENLKKVPFVFSALKFIKKIIWIPLLTFEELGFLKKSFQSVKEVDLLLFTGSNQFLDNFGGPWGFPYTLLKWSCLARMAGKKTAHISIGAGPLDKFLSKSFISGSVYLSHYLSFRDKGSRELTKRFLGFKSSLVFPDLAHSLLWEYVEEKDQENKKKDRLVVGINPMPIYDKRYWHIADDNKYEEYVVKVGDFTMSILKDNFRVELFGTHPKDQDVCSDVLNYLSEKLDSKLLSQCTLKSTETVSDVMSLISSFDLVVATRFHGVLLSLLAGKCVVALCYGAKTNELMVEVGQGQYTLDFESFSLEELETAFLNLYQNMEHQKCVIEKNERVYRESLGKQYESILQLLN